MKHDKGKLRWDKFHWEAAEAMLLVTHAGAGKYEWDNWRKGMKWSRMWSAALRHLLAFRAGQDKDKEFGLLHLAHAAWCVMTLLTYQLLGLGEDDRGSPKKYLQKSC